MVVDNPTQGDPKAQKYAGGVRRGPSPPARGTGATSVYVPVPGRASCALVHVVCTVITRHASHLAASSDSNYSNSALRHDSRLSPWRPSAMCQSSDSCVAQPYGMTVQARRYMVRSCKTSISLEHARGGDLRGSTTLVEEGVAPAFLTRVAVAVVDRWSSRARRTCFVDIWTRGWRVPESVPCVPPTSLL